MRGERIDKMERLFVNIPLPRGRVISILKNMMHQ